MTTSAVYPLLRSELHAFMAKGDAALASAMNGSTALFAANSEIVRENTEHNVMYRMRSGWAARVRTLDDGRRQFIAIFLAEDLMAVKALFMDRQPDSIICLSDVTADRLDYRSALELFARDPSVAARIAFQLGEDERRLHNWNIGLGCADARERIAFMFVELYGRLKRLGLLRDAKSFNCPMRQQQIGDRVGLTVVHVNRVLRRFREDGILTVQSRRVSIENLPELVRIAEPLFDVFEREAPEFNASAA
jgi:CRP/FNR family transcriptional regulator, anaerobic regulatory protein